MELKIQKLKNWKKIIIGVTIVTGITLAITLTTSKAKYRTTESIPLIRGKISYKPADLNVVALYQENESGEYESIDSVPSNGYALNTSESYCEVNKIKDTSITMVYENGLINFNGISKKGTKCYLYFDKYVEPTMKNILSQRNIVAMPKITGVETADTTGTVYSVEDDLGTSYVFRGAPTDNWVDFGGYYWQIIRMNGDGSTRMIYAGTSTSISGEDDHLSTKSTYNSNCYENAHVGYMYGTAGSSTYEETHINTNNSTIKGNLDTWYNNELNITEIKAYIDGNVGFCNDRSIYSGNGYGTNTTYYAAYNRLNTNKTPTLKCTNESADLFTTAGSNKGNGKLTYPVGLITADEVVYAGGFVGTASSGYWLYTGQSYWTMSPADADENGAYVYYMFATGNLSNSWVFSTSGIRPVINLKADTKFTGTGNTTNPFQLSVE